MTFTRHRRPDYYSRVADACDELIALRGGKEMKDFHLNGNDLRLPRVLLELKSTDVAVFTNRVNVFFNTAARYAVGWEQNDSNVKVWWLTAYGDSEPVRLLIRTNK